MQISGARCVVLLGFSLAFLSVLRGAGQSGGDFSNNAAAKKLPPETILVKGAWSSASDSTTPVPEGGRMAKNVYTNSYFGLTYSFSADWTEKYSGPPPSDSGYYVLAQIRPSDTFKGASRGSILIGARDLFFTLTPASNAHELVNFTTANLSADYKLERAPAEVRIADHSFVRFDYASPVAQLHWSVLATEIRCHAVQFVVTSRDTNLIESVIQEMNTMKLPAAANPTSGTGGDDVPVCVKDYATGENLLERVDPIFTERRFNAVPVRVVIDKEGKVKHIHFLSAFPEQAAAVGDALRQWRFKPYIRDGQPVEIETGILFGRAPRAITPRSASSATE
jgi:hypothetical protein